MLLTAKKGRQLTSFCGTDFGKPHSKAAAVVVGVGKLINIFTHYYSSFINIYLY
jgi:hypothetical protein